MFWAPSATALPGSRRATSVSHGKGGNRTTSTLAAYAETESTTDRVRMVASCWVVFIFQLPTTSGLRTWPHLERALSESP